LNFSGHFVASALVIASACPTPPAALKKSTDPRSGSPFTQKVAQILASFTLIRTLWARLPVMLERRACGGEGTYSGVIQGSYVNGDTSFITTLDSATTSVYGYTADTTAQVSVAGRQGTLLLKNAGFINVLTRQLAELESIVGGTGELAGASGLLFVTGTFDANNNGRFAYAGQVCLP
jgi:hypothetical protein